MDPSAIRDLELRPARRIQAGSRTRALAIVAAIALVAMAAFVPTGPADAARRKKRAKKPGAAVITIDLAELEVEGDPALTIALPEDLWRAHLVRMLKYPRKNQLTEAEGPRVASRWLKAQESDGRGFHSEIFIVVEQREGNSLREWARYIANESDSIFPFEDAVFDGPWVINERKVTVGGKKKLRGYILENSGGRKGDKERAVWQFALLPFPAGCQTMIGVKRKAPQTWSGGSSSGGTSRGQSSGGDAPDVAGGGGVGGSDGGGGALADGVGSSDDLGSSITQPNNNQLRASSELFRTLLAGIQVAVPKKLKEGLRRFRLRDEWNGARGGLTSRFVGIDVPATWRSTPTTALRSSDRIEWTELDDDGQTAAVFRVEFASSKFDGSIAKHANERLADWDVADAKLEIVVTRDGTSMAVLCPTEITADYGLRRGDDKDWVREAGFVMASDTFYVIQALRPPGTTSRLATLREMLASIEIFVAN